MRYLTPAPHKSCWSPLSTQRCPACTTTSHHCTGQAHKREHLLARTRHVPIAGSETWRDAMGHSSCVYGPADAWTVREHAREQTAVASVRAAVAPCTLMLHPEVFGRTLQFFAEHEKTLTSGFVPSVNVVNSARSRDAGVDGAASVGSKGKGKKGKGKGKGKGTNKAVDGEGEGEGESKGDDPSTLPSSLAITGIAALTITDDILANVKPVSTALINMVPHSVMPDLGVRLHKHAVSHHCAALVLVLTGDHLDHTLRRPREPSYPAVQSLHGGLSASPKAQAGAGCVPTQPGAAPGRERGWGWRHHARTRRW